MVKAIFFDTDGTLIPFGQEKMPASTLNALTFMRMQGLKLFVITNKHPKYLDNIRSDFEFDGYITLNGQYSWAGAQVLQCHPLPKDVIESFLHFRQQQNTTCIMTEINAIYANESTPTLALYATIHQEPLPPIGDLSRALQHQVFQITAFLTEAEEEPLKPSLPNVTFRRWSPMFSILQPKDIHKHQGISIMLQHFGFTLEQSMAFADGETDIPLLETAHIGVAMGNSTNRLQAVADYTTTPAEQDGIYHALVHYKIIEGKSEE